MQTNVLVQGFKLEIRRSGMPARYMGDVHFRLDTVMKGTPEEVRRELLSNDGKMMAASCRGLIIQGLGQFKEKCAQVDAVRLCGGTEVHLVCETLGVLLAGLPGVQLVQVDLTEMGASWTHVAGDIEPPARAREPHLRAVPDDMVEAERFRDPRKVPVRGGLHGLLNDDVFVVVCTKCGADSPMGTLANQPHNLCGGVWLPAGGGQ